MTYWNLNKQNWIVFQEKKLETLTNNAVSQSELLYIQNKKPLSKGSLVSTPDGYGILQEVTSKFLDRKYIEEEDEEAKFLVKIKENIKQFNYMQISTKIYLNLKLFVNNSILKEKMLIPTTHTLKDLHTQILQISQGYINEDKGTGKILLFYKGNKIEIEENNKNLLDLNLLENETLVVLIGSGYKKKSLVRYEPSRIYEYWSVNSGSRDALIFKVNKDLVILGFGTFLTDQYQKSNGYQLENYQIKIALYRGDNENDLLAEKSVYVNYIEQTNLPNDQKKLVEEVIFEKPVKIRKNEQYTVVMNVMSSGCVYYMEYGKDVLVTEEGLEFTFTYSNLSDTGTSPDCGQFPEIYYAEV